MAQLLREAGWEVTEDEGEVVASREKQGAWTLAVDGSGRLLFTATRPLRPARARRITHAGRMYRTSWEEHGVFTVATTIFSPEDLQQVIGHLPALMSQARQQQGKTNLRS
jgi:hypothetical protein